MAVDLEEDHRVIIYYSGHGTSIELVDAQGLTFHREALVPVDVAADGPSMPRLLYDYELNRLLAGIAARTACVTVLLDCCHSAGLTRGPRDRGAMRCFDLRDLGLRETPQIMNGADLVPRAGSSLLGGLARSIEDLQVVAACQEHEQAWEWRTAEGSVHGVFTEALLHALAGVTDDELQVVSWQRIWERVCARVAHSSPHQHVKLAGNAARAVLAGPPVKGDAGLPLSRVDRHYEIGAGTLASVTEGALVAVYGPRPLFFPPLGTPDDLSQRLGLLRVTTAGLSEANGEPEGATFELLDHARGRLVATGRPGRLRCQIVPASPEIVSRLKTSALIDIVDGPGEVSLLKDHDGRWLLADDLHEPDPAHALVVLEREQLSSVRPLLEHYFRYSMPMRIAAAARALPGALALRVLRCMNHVAADQAQSVVLPEAPMVRAGTFALVRGERVCLRVHNTSREQLRVILMISSDDGRVRIVGEHGLAPSATRTFWENDMLGVPFTMTLAPGRTTEIDRLTAIGTTDLRTDLRHLVVAHGFSDILERRRSHEFAVERDLRCGDGSRVSPLAVMWTATQVVVRTRAEVSKDKPSLVLPGVPLLDCEAQAPEVDVLASLRSDAPPLWEYLGQGCAGRAITEGNGWLGKESDPRAALGVKLALSVAHLLEGRSDGALVTAEGALDDALLLDQKEQIAFLGVCLRSIGVSLERGALATLVARALRRLARCPREDAWQHRWAIFQFTFARILLRNGWIVASIRAFDELSLRLRAGSASEAVGRALATLLARADLHRTQAGVWLTRLEDELPPSINTGSALRAALALGRLESSRYRLDAALAAADLELALRSPAPRVAVWVRLTERLAGTANERVRALARRGALATRDPAERATFLHAEQLCSPSELLGECPRPDPALLGTLFRVAASALDLGEMAVARRWLDIVLTTRQDAPADLLAAIWAMHSELELCAATGTGIATECSTDETRTRFENTIRSLSVPGGVSPDLLDAFGRLTYVLVMQCLPSHPREALIVLERARALRFALTAETRIDAAACTDATSAVVDGAGLAIYRESGRIPVLPNHVLRLVFMWDNRRGRLGVFTVMAGEEEPAVSFRWIMCSEPTLHALIDEFERMRGSSRPTANMPSLLRDEILCAPTSIGETLAQSLADPRVRRVIIVPHGPLAGLPLHAAVVGLQSNVTVSYAPLLSMSQPLRPAASVRASFCGLAGPVTDHDKDHIRAEIETCRGILTDAGLTATPATTSLENGPRADVPEVGLLHIAAHGASVGNVVAARRDRRPGHLEDSQRWRAAHIDLGDTSERREQWTERAILRARPLRVDTVLLGCCEGARATNPSVTWLILDPARPTASWQVPFLESFTHGVAGALLAAGAGEVLAYPHHVLVECPYRFFTTILHRYAAERARGVVADPGDYDWATATAATLQELASSSGINSPLQVELQLIQHWIAPATMVRRDSRDGGAS